jgi:myosin heavy subunit
MTSQLALIFSGVLALVFLSVVVALWLQMSKLKAHLETKNAKLIDLEARLSKQGMSSKAVPSKKEKPAAVSTSQNEVLELRREISQLKDENKRTKEDLRQKETLLKDFQKSKENEFYNLSENNKALTEQLKEFSKRGEELQKQRVDLDSSLHSATRGLEKDLHDARNQVRALEKSLQAESSRKTQALERTKELERSLTELKGLQQGGKPIDPAAFARWRERALEGRKMYKMMKQLRDMSDLKLSTYQKGIVILSQQCLLDNANLVDDSLPSEGNTDALFALALDVCGRKRMALGLPNSGALSEAAEPLTH